MTTLMIELPPDLYHRLKEVAAHEAKKPAEWVRLLLEERLVAVPEEKNEFIPAIRSVCRSIPGPKEVDEGTGIQVKAPAVSCGET